MVTRPFTNLYCSFQYVLNFNISTLSTCLLIHYCYFTDTTKEEQVLQELKANHASELESYIEMCSGLNNQLSTLSEELSDQAQLKADLETQIEQLSDEIAQQSESATAKIQTLQDENNNLISKCNDTQESATAKIQTLEDENNNFISKCNDTQSKLEQLQIEKETEMKELQKQLSEETMKIEGCKDQAEKAIAKAKSLQANYDSLVSNQGDSKELIQDRDKAKAKCELLTDKYKKLLAKCKQQETVVKQHKKSLENQSLVEVKCSDLEKELAEKIALVEQLQENIEQITSEINELKDNEENSQIMMENLQRKFHETLEKAQVELKENKEKHEDEILKFESEIKAREAQITESKTKEQELNDAVKGLQLELEEAVEANKDSINGEIQTLRSELQVRFSINLFSNVIF